MFRGKLKMVVERNNLLENMVVFLKSNSIGIQLVNWKVSPTLCSYWQLNVTTNSGSWN